MTPGFLLDTDILVELLRGRGDGLRARFNRHEESIHVSSVSVMELVYGCERAGDVPRSHRAVAEFLAFVSVLDFDAPAALEAGKVRAALARAGTPIGAYDVLLAGHARARALTLVKRNVGEFARVPGLVVESW